MNALAQIKSKFIKKLFGCAALLVLVSCSIPTTVVFANARRDNIVVVYKGDLSKIEELKIVSGQKAEIKHLLDVGFRIHTVKSILYYERAAVPEKYIQYFGFGPFMTRTVHAQIREDDCVYLAAPEGESTSSSVKQPQEFQMCPMTGRLP